MEKSIYQVDIVKQDPEVNATLLPDISDTVFMAAIKGCLKDLKDLLDHLPQEEVSSLLFDSPAGVLLEWEPGDGGVHCGQVPSLHRTDWVC